MAGIEVVAVDNKKALNEFVELPFAIYGDDPHWVPQLRIAVKELLDRKKHPFYANAEAEFFLARRDGKVVGRVAAIVDRNHNRFHEENAGFFGFFECVNDVDVARALLLKAREWTFDRGATFLRGPVSPSTNYECAMLIDGFDSAPMVMMTYNPRYYPELMDRVGLAMKLQGFCRVFSLNANTIDMKKIDRVAGKALKTSGVTTFWSYQHGERLPEGTVEKVWEVYGAAWMRNWGFIPMTREEFFLMGKEMKQILSFRLCTHRRSRQPRRRFCSRFARRKPSAPTGPRKPVPNGPAQNPVLSTFDQKCAGPRAGSRRRVPGIGPGGGFLRHFGPECAKVGLRRLRDVVDS